MFSVTMFKHLLVDQAALVGQVVGWLQNGKQKQAKATIMGAVGSECWAQRRRLSPEPASEKGCQEKKGEGGRRIILRD